MPESLTSLPPRAAARRLAIAAALLLAGMLAALAAPAGAPLAPATAAAAETKPVGYYMFRTRDTGRQPTSEQNRRCNHYFGWSSIAAVTRLNALLFAYETDPATGRITNQTKSLLGPGFICAVPSGRREQMSAYAYSSLPGPGLVEASGRCSITSIIVDWLPLILSCRLGVKEKPSAGVEGGLITSNSLVNTLNRSESAPTGSVWTAQIVGDAVNPGGEPGEVPANIKPETPGLDFFTARTRGDERLGAAPECGEIGVRTPSSVRRTRLVAAQPDPVSGRVPEPATDAPDVGTMTICFRDRIRGGVRASMVAELDSGTRALRVVTNGSCSESATTASPELLAQACTFQVRRGVRAGLVTSNGLIADGDPARAGDSGAWTFALFGV